MTNVRYLDMHADEFPYEPSLKELEELEPYEPSFKELRALGIETIEQIITNVVGTWNWVKARESPTMLELREQLEGECGLTSVKGPIYYLLKFGALKYVESEEKDPRIVLGPTRLSDFKALQSAYMKERDLKTQAKKRAARGRPKSPLPKNEKFRELMAKFPISSTRIPIDELKTELSALEALIADLKKRAGIN